jgi:hypothetical protein
MVPHCKRRLPPYYSQLLRSDTIRNDPIVLLDDSAGIAPDGEKACLGIFPGQAFLFYEMVPRDGGRYFKNIEWPDINHSLMAETIVENVGRPPSEARNAHSRFR